jgi:hypothetical protein
MKRLRLPELCLGSFDPGGSDNPLRYASATQHIVADLVGCLVSIW